MPHISEKCSIEMGQFLVEQGADLYSRHAIYGQDCLGEASKFGFMAWKFMALLLQHGASLRPGMIFGLLHGDPVEDGCYFSQFRAHVLPWLDSFAVSELTTQDKWALVTAGVECPTIKKFLNACAGGYPASFAKSYEIQQQLIEIKQATAGQKRSFACWVVTNGSRRMVELIFLRSIDPTLSLGGMSLVHYALSQPWNADALLDAGARPCNTRNSELPGGFWFSDRMVCNRLIPFLSVITETKSWLPLIDKLIDKGYTHSGHPPWSLDLYLAPEVFNAVLCGNQLALQKLISRGASLTYEAMCYTSLDMAVLLGLVNIVQTLLKAGSQADKSSFDGRKILKVSHECLKEEHPRKIPFCLNEWGPDVWTIHYKKETYNPDARGSSYWDHHIQNYLSGDPWIQLEADRAINSMLIEAFGHLRSDQRTQKYPRLSAHIDNLCAQVTNNAVFRKSHIKYFRTLCS